MIRVLWQYAKVLDIIEGGALASACSPWPWSTVNLRAVWLLASGWKNHAALGWKLSPRSYSLADETVGLEACRT